MPSIKLAYNSRPKFILLACYFTPKVSDYFFLGPRLKHFLWKALLIPKIMFSSATRNLTGHRTTIHATACALFIRAFSSQDFRAV